MQLIIENSYIIYLIAFFSISYLVGSIPFGLILSNLWGYGDIRKVGSGNIGATNALRTGNKLLAFLVLLLDSLKGYLIITIFTFSNYSENLDAFIFLILFGCVFGHCYPIWLKFRGGKGIATTLGCLIALNFSIGILICLCWLAVCLISKKSSLASLLSISCLPFITFIYYGIYELIFSIMLMLMIYLRHKDNLIRILKSEEPNVFGK
ncbi:MAG: acyl-phosphate glycerol 3-phosphate acyltransferase [SAR116 cluster bacterium]|nr:acyl-phosphate glycerol 3-phosphate acyltransferase [SAR116 cluster bacterium]